MPHIEHDHIETEMQSRGADQEVLEGDADALGHLLPFDSSGELRDLYTYWMHDHVAIDFFGKGLAAGAIRFSLGAVDAVR